MKYIPKTFLFVIIMILAIVVFVPRGSVLADTASPPCDDPIIYEPPYYGPPPSRTNPIDTGHFENQKMAFIDIYPVMTCDDDGTYCGHTAISEIKKTLDGTNAIHYRSDSRVRFRISPFTNLDKIWDDTFNNWCLLGDNITVAAVLVDNKPVYYLKEGGQAITDSSRNSDDLCVPVDHTARNDFGYDIQQQYGAVAVYIKQGYRKVKWEAIVDSFHLWRIYRASGGNSGCSHYYIDMPSNLNSPNLFAHESGHYLCSPHPHDGISLGSGETVEQQIIDQIEEHVNNGFAAPWETEKIVEDLLNKDDEVTYSGIASYLNAPFYDINDTSPDAGSKLFTQIYENKGGKCGFTNGRVDITVNFDGQPYTYTIQPDRQNIMSYFKGCFHEDIHFSRRQAYLAELVTLNHRAPVAKHEWKRTWRNSKDVYIPEPGYGEMKWATGYIKVDDREDPGQISRVIIGVDIKHPRGGLNIYVVSPDGQVFNFHQPNDNKNQISGDVKTLFFINNVAGIQKNGLWKLLVAEEAYKKIKYKDKKLIRDIAEKLDINQEWLSPDDVDETAVINRESIDLLPATIEFTPMVGKIDDWQIQFNFMTFRPPPGVDF